MKHISSKEFRPDPALAAPAAKRRADAARTRSLAGWGALAAGLAATAIYNGRRAAKAEAERPAQGNFVEVNGVRVHYVEQGTGSPVLLFHGNAVTLRDWERSGVAAAIAAGGHRVISFDRPGFGYTPRPRDTVWTLQRQAKLLMDAAAKLGADKPVIVGHSMGASIALAAAIAQPEAVSGIVLISGYYYWTPRIDVPLVATPAIPGVGDVVRYTVSPVLGRALWGKSVKAMFHPLDPPAGFVEDTIGLTNRPSQIRAISSDSVLLGPSMQALTSSYAGLNVPAILIAGDDDKIIGPDTHSRRLCETLPNCTLRALTGVGHMTPYADPQGVAAAVDELSR